MDEPIPDRMQALVLSEYQEDLTDAIKGLSAQERPVPKPERKQVLVRVEAAPCNPSDLLLLQGKYGRLKTLPTVPGWEGAGTVVASGGGWLANWLRGKRVACGGQSDRDGTWAEYFVADASQCIPLKRSITTEQGASLIINPLTAMGLLDTARRAGHRAAVHTAGASQVGRMLLNMASDAGFPLINVVRRAAQVELLKGLGAQHVLDSSREDFFEQLMADCNNLGATAAFEAIAGDMTGTILAAMPPGATVYVYGALSEEACGNIDPIGLIFREQTVTGFYLSNWLQDRGKLGVIRAAGRVQKLVAAGHIETTVQQRLSLSEAVEGLLKYTEDMTGGKALILPGGSG